MIHRRAPRAEAGGRAATRGSGSTGRWRRRWAS